MGMMLKKEREEWGREMGYMLYRDGTPTF